MSNRIPYIEPNTFAVISFYPKTNETIISFMGRNYLIKAPELSAIGCKVLESQRRKTIDYYEFAEQVRMQMLAEVVSKWIAE